jgi:hypothetical protein
MQRKRNCDIGRMIWRRLQLQRAAVTRQAMDITSS